jgi:hypothetical protein
LWILPFDQHPNKTANGLFAEELFKLLGEKGVLGIRRREDTRVSLKTIDRDVERSSSGDGPRD